jgi:hypothetical protein
MTEFDELVEDRMFKYRSVSSAMLRENRKT